MALTSKENQSAAEGALELAEEFTTADLGEHGDVFQQEGSRAQFLDEPQVLAHPFVSLVAEVGATLLL